MWILDMLHQPLIDPTVSIEILLRNLHVHCLLSPSTKFQNAHLREVQPTGIVCPYILSTSENQSNKGISEVYL